MTLKYKYKAGVYQGCLLILSAYNQGQSWVIKIVEHELRAWSLFYDLSTLFVL